MSAPHMSGDEFRRAGHLLVDWIADYWSRLDDLPVLATTAPGEIRRELPPTAPASGESFDAILADLDDVVLPGITHWQSPGFFGFFPANISPASVLGELASAGLGVQGMMWSTSPAATELETLVLDWLRDMVGLPERFSSNGPGGGVIEDSASSSTLVATLAARRRADTSIDRLVAYASTEAHSSVEKAVRIAGIRHLRLIETDETFAMRSDLLAAAMAADADAGLVPCLVVATVGTTSSTAVDPVRAISETAGEYRAWVHVDAAYAGTAALLPEMRWINDGVGLVDSYCLNPHKWMLTNFDCSAFYVADRSALISALGIVPEYLRNPASESGAVLDYRDWQIPLGRRFRALKLWFVIRSYGVEGLQAHVRHHIALAADVASRVDRHPLLELVAPVRFGLVCFRHVDGDEATSRLLETVNASGSSYLTHTRLDGRLTARMAIGGTFTDQRHIDRAWAAIEAGAALSEGR